MEKGIITAAEKQLCRDCVSHAIKVGASAIRISLSKSIQNSIAVLDGEIDRISYSEDRSVFLHVFAEGRYGTFSTNRLGKDELEEFIAQAVATTVLLVPDPCRRLPEAHLKAKGCSEGDELDLVDSGYSSITQEQKIAIAKACANPGVSVAQAYTVESVESEYSDSLDDNFMVDSDGFEGRHIESSFGFCSEVTVIDGEGNRYSGYQWTATPKFRDFHPENITAQAIEDAAAQIGPRNIKSGKYTVVVHAKAASRLIGPILSALDGNSIQQNFSFLGDRVGEKVFSDKMTLYDAATAKGKAGSRLFDTEGVATEDGPIIENGVVKKVFVNTYCACKTGMKQTVEGVSRPTLQPYICNSAEKEINLDDILASCGNGILVTGFNGGNCNQATGNFSFGIEGFLFQDGKIVHPTDEALMTGDMTSLWNSLLAVGSDARECARWQIPSLAFENIDINA